MGYLQNNLPVHKPLRDGISKQNGWLQRSPDRLLNVCRRLRNEIVCQHLGDFVQTARCIQSGVEKFHVSGEKKCRTPATWRAIKRWNTSYFDVLRVTLQAKDCYLSCYIGVSWIFFFSWFICGGGGRTVTWFSSVVTGSVSAMAHIGPVHRNKLVNCYIISKSIVPSTNSCNKEIADRVQANCHQRGWRQSSILRNRSTGSPLAACVICIHGVRARYFSESSIFTTLPDIGRTRLFFSPRFLSTLHWCE